MQDIIDSWLLISLHSLKQCIVLLGQWELIDKVFKLISVDNSQFRKPEAGVSVELATFTNLDNTVAYDLVG